MAFCSGFEKVAKEKSDKDKHWFKRIMLGNPASAAISAKSGSRLAAYHEALQHARVEMLEGIVPGAVVGIPVGALAGLIAAKKSKKFTALKGTGGGAGLGAAVGGLVGAQAGAIKGHLGHKATKIHQKYQP